MNAKQQNEKIEIARKIAISIDCELKKLQTIVADLAQPGIPIGEGHTDGAASSNGIQNPTKPKKKACNNPLPRAERLRPTYLGNPADFERTAPTITPEIKRRVKQLLELPLAQVIASYGDGLSLKPYTHSSYKFCATLQESVIGSPARRYFTDLPEAVTWLEIIRARQNAGNLKHNIPRGGVRRDEFQMTWEKKKDVPTGTQAVPSPVSSKSRHWTAEQHANHAASAKSKRAHRSVNPFTKGGAVRPQATAAQILGVAAMPGNNLGTASITGSTAATSQGQLPPTP